jgi:hypothetical protein
MSRRESPRLEDLAARLKRTSPLLYRFARPPWRLYRWLFPSDRYWQQRQHFKYYAEVVRLARQHAPAGGRVIDVGAGPTRVLQDLGWFDERVALDRLPERRQPGIKTVQQDFLVYEPGAQFDLVLCLQVLEHLDDPRGFAQKLFAIGRTIIISVPYKWPHQFYPPHKQDPVDETKLAGWTRRTPIETSIVMDNRERLIAVYRDP